MFFVPTLILLLILYIHVYISNDRYIGLKIAIGESKITSNELCLGPRQRKSYQWLFASLSSDFLSTFLQYTWNKRQLIHSVCLRLARKQQHTDSNTVLMWESNSQSSCQDSDHQTNVAIKTNKLYKVRRFLSHFHSMLCFYRLDMDVFAK